MRLATDGCGYPRISSSAVGLARRPSPCPRRLLGHAALILIADRRSNHQDATQRSQLDSRPDARSPRDYNPAPVSEFAGRAWPQSHRDRAAPTATTCRTFSSRWPRASHAGVADRVLADRAETADDADCR